MIKFQKIGFAFLLVFIAFSCSNKNSFVIKGTIQNAKQAYVYLVEMDLDYGNKIDSAELSDDGTFKIKHSIQEAGFYQLMLTRDNFIIVAAFPGDKIIINANADNMTNTYTVEGSETSQQVRLLTQKLNKTIVTIDSLTTALDKNAGMPNYDSIWKSINQQYVNTINDQRKFSIKFVVEHLNSLASIVALYQQIDDSTLVLNQNKDLQYVNLVADTLKKYYPNVKHVKGLVADRERMMGAYNMLRLGSLFKNNSVLSFPEIALPNAKGDTIKLSGIKNKAIAVYFWSPRNEECLYNLENLRDLHKIYAKKGFELYNVALEQDVDGWRTFITKSEIPGVNVIDAAANKSSYINIYNLTGLPAIYLINKNGEITGKNLFGDDLENKIKEIVRP